MVTKMLPARSKVPNSTPKAHSELPKPTKYDKSLIDGWELSLKGRRLSERTPKGSYLPAVELLARWRAGSKKPTLDNLERGDLDAWLVWLQERPRPAGESHC